MVVRFVKIHQSGHLRMYLIVQKNYLQDWANLVLCDKQNVVKEPGNLILPFSPPLHRRLLFLVCLILALLTQAIAHCASNFHFREEQCY